jgi:hypothetical protein
MRIPCLALALSTTTFAAPLSELLAPYFDLQPQDSVTALRSHSGNLEVDVLHRQTLETRTLRSTASAANTQRLVSQASAEGVAIDTATAVAPVAAPPVFIPDRSRRWDYINVQSATSGIIYGWTVPLALKSDGTTFIGINLLSIPGSYLGHILFSRGKEFGDAQFNGVHAYTTAMLVGSYGLGTTLFGPNENSFRVPALATALAYPFAVVQGYEYGSRYRDNPGRIALRSNVAFVGGLVGLLTPFALSPTLSEESTPRLAAALTTGGYFGGHLLADQWNPGQRVAGGVGDGISQVSILGALAGLEIGAIVNTDEPQANVALIAGGAAAGLVYGWNYFKTSPDSRERSNITALGLSGGFLGGIGALFMSGADSRLGVTTCLTAGPAIGYLVTRSVTDDLIERDSRTKSASLVREARFELAPRLAQVRIGRSERLKDEWSIPGLVVSFK